MNFKIVEIPVYKSGDNIYKQLPRNSNKKDFMILLIEFNNARFPCSCRHCQYEITKGTDKFQKELRCMLLLAKLKILL